MTTKLTLTVDKDTIEKAKLYARHTGRSLSGLVETYLAKLTDEQFDQTQLSPKLKKLVGVIRLPEDFDEENALRNYFEVKHR